MNQTFNRPISPHLTIYSIQFTSSFSIWHRISAIILFSSYFFCLFFSKLLVWNYSFFTLYILLLNTLFWKIALIIILVNLFYHFLNGIRHIFWDVALFLTINNVYISSRCILFIIFFLQLFLINHLFSCFL